MARAEHGQEAIDWNTEFLAGRNLSTEETKRLEDVVLANPSDFAARARLLGHYLNRPDGHADRIKHMSHIIKESPLLPPRGSHLYVNPDRYPEDYSHIRSLLTDRLNRNPSEAATIRTLADFVITTDKETYEKLLLKGREVEPEESSWPAALGRFHYRQAMFKGERTRLNDALTFTTEACQKSGGTVPLQLHRTLARIAFEVGRLDLAAETSAGLLKYASEQRGNQLAGDAWYDAHEVLGLIALQKSDLNSAKEHLLLAAQTEGSPELEGGPSFRLADELLHRDERQVVIDYLNKCREFWHAGSDWLSDAVDSIEQGTNPFGGMVPKRD